MRAAAMNNGFAGLVRRRIFGEAAWAFFGQVGSGVVLLLGTRIITELVPPQTYGQVALMVGAVALGVSIFAYPFVSAGMRLLPETLHKGQRRELNHALAKLAGRSVLVALLLLALAAGGYGYATGEAPWLFACAGVLLVVTARREFGVQLLIGERKQREATLWQTSDSLLRPLLAIGLVYWLGPKAALVLLGYILASAAANLAWSRAGRGAEEEPAGHGLAAAGSLRREILAYALPLIPMELLAWFSSLGDRYVIGYLMTAADVGIYAAAYTLVNEAFHRSAIVLLRTFQPVYFGHCANHRIERALRVFALWLGCVLAVGAIGVLALVVLKDWVAAVFLAPVYHDAALLMPVIGLGCALQALGTLMAQPLYARKHTRALLYGRFAGTATAAVAIPLMVQWHGLLGAALAAPLYFGTEALVLALIAKPWSANLVKGEAA